MPRLLLGPLLRYVGRTEATVWVETDAACEVQVLGHRSPTFAVAGHHYAIVAVRDLEPGTEHPYEVHLDGTRHWPQEGSSMPPSVVRTLGHPSALRIAFGSCRVALPHEAPFSLSKDEDDRGRGVDALHALALRLRVAPREEWPDLLLMLGDQIYADEVSPGTREFIASRRSLDGPAGEAVIDFEEYHHLYLDAWGDRTIRWLLSTVPTAMIFDDHDVHDDWNTSSRWLTAMREQEWWNEHIVSALSSYWVYQHLGNLTPDELDADETLARVRAADDGGELLADFARRADRDPSSVRWSYARDIGGTRLVVLDSRAGRVLDEERRSMLDPDEWAWLEDRATGDVDHLLVATSLPVLLAPALHGLEAWSEAVCAGAWGRRLRGLGEQLRQAVDLEHWAAFDASFRRISGILESVATGRRGAAPASIVLLSGDVHHAYVARATFRGAPDAATTVHQAVCSPMRNALDHREQRAIRAAFTRPVALVARVLSRLAGVAPLPVRWRLRHRRPWFGNQVATLVLDDRRADLVLEEAVAAGPAGASLEQAFSQRLA